MIFSNVLIINPQHGLGNRIRAIASAYSIAKANHLTLAIHWIPDDHCNCRLEDIFSNTNYFGEVLEQISPEDMASFKVYNYMTTESNGNKNETIDLQHNAIYCKSNCILMHPNNYCYFSEFFCNLKFHPRILRYISHFQVSQCIGIHIRIEETDKTYENSTDNWTIQEHNIMSSHRQLSKMENFMNQINRELHFNPSQTFFISSKQSF